MFWVSPCHVMIIIQKRVFFLNLIKPLNLDSISSFTLHYHLIIIFATTIIHFHAMMTSILRIPHHTQTISNFWPRDLFTLKLMQIVPVDGCHGCEVEQFFKWTVHVQMISLIICDGASYFKISISKCIWCTPIHGWRNFACF